MSEANPATIGLAVPSPGDTGRRNPLELFAVDDQIRIIQLPATSRLIVRGGDDARQVMSTGLGFEVPAEACRSAGDGRCMALWLGPDEWLLLAPFENRAALSRQLAAAAEGIPHALIDVSDRQVGYELAGRLADEVLNTGCPLDLDATTFGVGACTRTVFGKVEIVLMRTADTTFRVETQRSVGAYVSAHLVNAARALTAA